MIWNSKFVRKVRDNFSSFEDVQLFVNIFLLVTVLPLLVRFLSLPQLMKVLTPQDLEVYNPLDLEKTKDKIVRFTDHILGRNFWIYKTICLKRSLVLYHFLRKMGINVSICFGVRHGEKENKKKLEGHAWLVYNGNVFLEKDMEMTKTYKMTYCFPEVQG